MRLFREVLIESVEQAEKLPVGTVAVRYDEQDRIWSAARRCRCEAVDCDVWFLTDDERPAGHEHMIGATALVPVEGEEETRSDLPGRRGINPVRRLVSHWEPAPDTAT